MTARRLPPLTVLLTALFTPLAAQSGPITDSYRRARVLLDQAIEAHGGIETLQAGGTIRVRMEGLDHWRNQSRRVEPPYDTEPWTADLWLDWPRTRLVWTNTSRFPGGFRNGNRVVIDGPNGFSANLPSATHVPVPNRSIETQRGNLNRLPHLILLAARDQAAGLRWLGRMATGSGAAVDAIVAPAPPGQLTLGFDPATRELRTILGVTGDLLAGDAATEVEFTDYRRTGRLLVPGRRVARVAGEVIQDVRYSEVTLGTPVPDSLLSPPSGSTPIGPPTPVTPIRELAAGVWALNFGGSWALAVAFADFALVVEPTGGGSAEAIAKVKELAPGKPIRYIVPTHHHDDHSGGIRHYVAEGATVLSTPGNRGYFARMAGSVGTLRADRQSQMKAPLKFEAIEGKRRTITDGTRTVELYDIGPSPHANEMVVAYLPREGILFQGDLLNIGGGTIYPSTANTTTVHFAEWLAGRGLDVRVLAGVHMAPGTKADLDTAMARRAPVR